MHGVIREWAAVQTPSQTSRTALHCTAQRSTAQAAKRISLYLCFSLVLEHIQTWHLKSSPNNKTIRTNEELETTAKKSDCTHTALHCLCLLVYLPQCDFVLHAPIDISASPSIV